MFHVNQENIYKCNLGHVLSFVNFWNYLKGVFISTLRK